MSMMGEGQDEGEVESIFLQFTGIPTLSQSLPNRERGLTQNLPPSQGGIKGELENWIPVHLIRKVFRRRSQPFAEMTK